MSFYVFIVNVNVLGNRLDISVPAHHTSSGLDVDAAPVVWILIISGHNESRQARILV